MSRAAQRQVLESVEENLRVRYRHSLLPVEGGKAFASRRGKGLRIDDGFARMRGGLFTCCIVYGATHHFLLASRYGDSTQPHPQPKTGQKRGCAAFASNREKSPTTLNADHVFSKCAPSTCDEKKCLENPSYRIGTAGLENENRWSRQQL